MLCKYQNTVYNTLCSFESYLQTCVYMLQDSLEFAFSFCRETERHLEGESGWNYHLISDLFCGFLDHTSASSKQFCFPQKKTQRICFGKSGKWFREQWSLAPYCFFYIITWKHVIITKFWFLEEGFICSALPANKHVTVTHQGLSSSLTEQGDYWVNRMTLQEIRNISEKQNRELIYNKH